MPNRVFATPTTSTPLGKSVETFKRLGWEVNSKLEAQANLHEKVHETQRRIKQEGDTHLPGEGLEPDLELQGLSNKSKEEQQLLNPDVGSGPQPRTSQSSQSSETADLTVVELETTDPKASEVRHQCRGGPYPYNPRSQGIRGPRTHRRGGPHLYNPRRANYFKSGT